MADLVSILRDAFDQMAMVDLTHTMEENMPVWPTHPHFYHNLVESYTLGQISCHYQLIMGEHTGTHIDAPLHFAQQGVAHYGIDQVGLERFCGRAATISATTLGPNGLLTRADVQGWEAENGSIQPGDMVLIRFGWDKLWAKRPNDAAFLKDWPGLDPDAAQYFVDKGVKLVGTDAVALDSFANGPSPSHKVLLNAEVLIVENLDNLNLLPPFSFFVAMPLKIAEGSGSPIRAIALVPRA